MVAAACVLWFGELAGQSVYTTTGRDGSWKEGRKEGEDPPPWGVGWLVLQAREALAEGRKVISPELEEHLRGRVGA